MFRRSFGAAFGKKADFLVSDSLKETELEKEREEDSVLEEQVTPAEFQSFLKEEKKSGPLRMNDIVKSGVAPEGRLFKSEIKEIPKEKEAAEIEVKETIQPPEPPEPILKPESESRPHIGYDKSLYERWGIKKREMAPPAEIEENEPAKRGVLAQRTASISSFSIKIFGLFVLSAVIITGLVFYLVLPKAEIKITAQREKLPIVLKVSAEKNLGQVDLSLNKIPAQLVKLEDSQSMEFPTTGERQLNEKAKGIITVFNTYSSSPQTLVETTRFLSTEGKIYRLTKTINIPGAQIEEGKIIPSSIDVEVEADQPGAEYNIGPSDFSIPGFKGSPKYSAFYGKSKKDIAGGSTEKVRVLTQDDFDKAKDKIWTDLEQKIQQELDSQIPQNFKLLDEAIDLQIGELKSSIEVGGKAESFTLTVRGIAKALIFSDQDLNQLLKYSLFGESADTKEFTDLSTLNYEDIKKDIDKGQMSFTVRGEQEIIWSVDKEEIKRIIAGKKEADVRQIFSERPEIKEAQISFRPFWIKTIPKEINKIDVTVD